MPANSKKQQRFMGMVHQCKKTGECASPEVKKVAKSIKAKDAKDFASTKHKNLPNQVSERHLTFKEYLLEFDIGDRQLQQQATNQQNQAAADEKARGAFSNEMAAAAPAKGDVIENSQGRFIVLGGSMEGIKIKELGGNRSGTIPHGTKFKNMGKSKSGTNLFSVVQNS